MCKWTCTVQTPVVQGPTVHGNRHRSLLLEASQMAQNLMVVKNLPANAGDVGDMGSNPELGSSPEKEIATNSSLLA